MNLLERIDSIKHELYTLEIPEYTLEDLDSNVLRKNKDLEIARLKAIESALIKSLLMHETTWSKQQELREKEKIRVEQAEKLDKDKELEEEIKDIKQKQRRHTGSNKTYDDLQWSISYVNDCRASHLSKQLMETPKYKAEEKKARTTLTTLIGENIGEGCERLQANLRTVKAKITNTTDIAIFALQDVVLPNLKEWNELSDEIREVLWRDGCKLHIPRMVIDKNPKYHNLLQYGLTPPSK